MVTSIYNHYQIASPIFFLLFFHENSRTNLRAKSGQSIVVVEVYEIMKCY